MRNHRITLSAACVAALLSILPQPAGAAEATREPVRVHGHWTIEVYNRDGTRASRNEFENALTPSGAQDIAAILNGRHSAGFRVLVSAVRPGTPPCSAGPAAPDPCAIAQPTPGVTDTANYFQTLQVTASAGALVLKGQFDVSNTTAIGLVVTVRSDTGNIPGIFETASTDGFTRAVLATPIPVEAGQTVKVRVDISFS